MNNSEKEAVALEYGSKQHQLFLPKERQSLQRLSYKRLKNKGYILQKIPNYCLR